MKAKELMEEFGIVRVCGHIRRKPNWRYRNVRGFVVVSPYYRSTPGAGPLRGATSEGEYVC